MPITLASTSFRHPQLYSPHFSRTVLRSGSSSIDKVLNGGVHLGELTEIYGTSATGKTQFVLSLATNLVSNDPVSHALLIDVNGGIHATRLRALLPSGGHDRIHLLRITHSESVLSSLPHILLEQLETLPNVRFIGVDSLGWVHKTLSGSGANVGSGAHLEPVVKRLEALTVRLERIAVKFRVAVVITNYAKNVRHVGEIDGLNHTGNMISAPRIPLCGERLTVPQVSMPDSWNYVCPTRIALVRDGHEAAPFRRSFILVKSPRDCLPKVANFKITSTGICDCDDNHDEN